MVIESESVVKVLNVVIYANSDMKKGEQLGS